MIEQLLQADRLLNVDQVSQARDAYARVVTLDPGNAIAVVGLARCALADGDDREAHALASRALTIDPDNDMARRMEARLAEILAARGEVLERAAPTGGSGSDLRSIVTDDRAGQPTTAGSLTTADTTPAVVTATSREPARPTHAPSASAPYTAARRSLLDRLRGR